MCKSLSIETKSKILIVWFIFLLAFPLFLNAQITVYNAGQPFTSITTDVNGEIWAGTSSNGLWKCRRINIPVPNTLERDFIKFSGDEQFNRFNIQSIAADKNGHIWVGHNGLGGSSAAGGGIDVVSEASRFGKNRHFIPYSRITKLQNGGIPSLDSKAITVDKNGTVWTANGYHDLFVSGVIPPYIDVWGNIYPGIPAQYILTCGGIAYKKSSAFAFDTINTIAAGIPYGAYTVNTPVDKSAGTRQCVSIAAGPTEVWAGVGFYESADAGIVGSRILRFNLDGSFIDYFDNTKSGSSGLPQGKNFSTRAVTIYFQSNGTGWVGFNQSRGFAVHKNGMFNYISALNDRGATSKLIPGGIAFANNSPGLISGRGNKVFLGTTSGLLMYKGKGDYAQDSSYVLYTTAHGLPSNNIRGVATDEESVWIATDKGIARMPIKADLFIYHLDDYPLDASTGSDRTLLNSVDEFGTDDIASYIAADSSAATVFLFKSSNAANLKFSIEENANEQVEINRAEFGYFRVIARSTDSIKVQYHHPRFIHASYLRNNQNGREVTLQIKDTTIDKLAFKTKLKLVLPPVLMVHGVWTDVTSLTSLYTYLRDNNDGYRYFDFQLLRKYRIDGSAEENPYAKDAGEVRNGITELISNCAKNNLSAGKVNLVCHSRGGLYARAYIQELTPEISYRFDINSLITLNTPHSGSQYANLILDKRIFRVTVPDKIFAFPRTFKKKDIMLGEEMSLFIPSIGDRNSKNGAQVLRVDRGFIIDLNNDTNLEKIRKYKVPVHAIATNFNLCSTNITLCAKIPESLMIIGRRYLPLSILLLLSKSPGTLDNFIKENIFNGEPNDFIVPRSSMEAGLDNKYISRFEGENLPHSDLPLSIKGIMATPTVHKRVADLLQQNLYDGSSNFSFNGFNPPRGSNRLRYNLFPSLSNSFGNPPPEHSRTTDENSSILIDTAIRGKKFEVTDTLKVLVNTTGNIKKLLIVYNQDGDDEDGKTYSDLRLAVDNPVFDFPIPADFYGKVNIIAYGFDDSTLTAIDTCHIVVGLPPSLQLLKLTIEGDEEIDIKQTTVHPYVVKGLFSDSIVRNITFSDIVQYLVRDTSILSLNGIGQIEARQQGYTYLVAVSGKKTDSILVNVIDNPILRQTLLNDFSAIADSSKYIKLNWTTHQEFRNAYFVIERSIKNGFDSIGVIKGSGTLYSASSYLFTDSLAFGDTMYYRLRAVDSTNQGVYFRVIMVTKNSVVLPLTLSSFSGYYLRNMVSLNWSTTTETNTKQFEIEAGWDGVNFQKIGAVPGSVNSSLLLNYTFDDVHFFKPGKNYYRLKQVDQDGKFTFSTIIVVSVDKSKYTSISFYPNPATNKITLNIEPASVASLQIKLLDINGKILWSKTIAPGVNINELLLPQLAKGIYIVIITDDTGEKLLTEKLVIQ